eukprot:gnl/Spiro4/14502_TR7814_c0_g1_i1.p2 gnl/Spiro4/14502_TR7814_c0_g1~~gnl/Spiro4/14502_TR7814_c0_g1_i1.p2  ORF type:complete len:187 (+),score=57.87 gnl/Spiro4/14502_TR7814_c0_g1_i1:51-563(+)
MSCGRVILLCGLPGSGKTTLAKQLECSLGAVRFCPDDWMDALALDLYDEQRRDKLERLQWTFAKQLICHGLTVIIEWGVWSCAERTRLRDEARSLGACVELRVLSATTEVLFERITRRAAEDPLPSFEQVQSWAAKFETPTPEELATYDNALSDDLRAAREAEHEARSWS